MSYVTKNLDTDTWDVAPTTIHASYIAVCTGLHVKPAVPHIAGIEYVLNKPPRLAEDGTKIHPEVYHSSQYKSRSQLKGRRVMILGTGETGFDIAYASAKGGAEEAVLCSQRGYVFLHNESNRVSTNL